MIWLILALTAVYLGIAFQQAAWIHREIPSEDLDDREDAFLSFLVGLTWPYVWGKALWETFTDGDRKP